MSGLSLIVVFMLMAAQAAAAPASDQGAAARRLVVTGPADLIQSSGTAAALAARETAGPDTFVLYGGPDEPVEGKFQLANRLTPDWGDGTGSSYQGAPGQWQPVDHTKRPVYWRRDTFNAENLNDNGAGNHAMWCGLAADDPLVDGWATPPGYGNSWFAELRYVSEPVQDEQVGQVVDLDFYLNYETEVDYDFVLVEYLRAGQWIEVGSFDGTNSDGLGTFPSPGVRFSDVQTAPIEYLGGDYGYGGLVSGGVVIRIVFTSDGAWSDEDGSFTSYAGAAQVDDISLAHIEGSFFEDFEGAGPYLFEPVQLPFAGDFADIHPQFRDIDPCRENRTPVAAFIDYGQVIRNGPGIPPGGGSIWPGIEYGIPGNYVVNWTGGISGGLVRLNNSIWSPPIELDLPGSGDDGVEFAGVQLSMDLWTHSLPTSAIFADFGVRSAMPGESWGQWESFPSIYGYSLTPQWRRFVWDMSDRIPIGAERIQVALTVVDYGDVLFGSQGATPAPVFDNVTVTKYRLPGPALSTRTVDLAQDAFPPSGSIDVGTAMARDALDIPFDMARDVNFETNSAIDPGDSIITDITASITGTTITDTRMVWALKTNALFEDALREAPARAVDENVVAGAAGTVWTGEVAGSQATVPGGTPIADRMFFDLPDVDFMYPGDVLHYYIEATDSDGRVSTVPVDLTGFGDFTPGVGYDRRFVLRGLPTLTAADGSQPSILVINDFGDRGGEEELLHAFSSLGYLEGVHYDTYTVNAPYSQLSNGIGSSGAYGATAAQLGGYENIFYFMGNLLAPLSNGADDGLNDKGNDIDVLEQWHALAGTRNSAWFGDNIATASASASSQGAAFVANTLRVEWIGDDVSAVVGGQLAPQVVAVPGAGFAGGFVTNGGCPGPRSFDHIAPGIGALDGHQFASPLGSPLGVSASIVYSQPNGVTITFPYAFPQIETPAARAVGLSARAALLDEILSLFSVAPGGPPVDVPEVRGLALDIFPNPFNPATTVSFTAAPGSKGSVKVYNLRGELVRVLHSGEFRQQEFTWDGTDQGGASVSSGVYVVRAETGGKRFNAKVALVK